MQVGRTTIPDRTPEAGVDSAATRTTGPGFDQMVAAAKAEAERRAELTRTTGATSDRFSDQAWLAVMKAHGGEIGLSAQAQAITRDKQGQYIVADPAARARIMNYRSDPLVLSVMAGKRATDSRATLTIALGRAPTDGEMRLSDVLGAKDAAQLLKAKASVPLSSAAIQLPEAATSRRADFFRPDGSPRTVSEVIDTLSQPRTPPASEAERLATGHMTFNTPGNPAESNLTAALKAQATADAKTRPFARATTPQSPGLQPDLDVTHATLGQVSIPGTTKGVTAPTGAKVNGWRGQYTGEVTQRLTNPQSVVSNVPTRVTVPAGPTTAPRPVPVAALPPPVPAVPPPAVATSDARPLPLSPNAVVTPTPPPSPLTMVADPATPVTRPATAPKVAPVAQPPVGTAPTTELSQPSLAILRPSRYGPVAAGLQPPLQAPATDIASAGIRPGRFAVASAIAIQQQASNQPQIGPRLLPIQSTRPVMPTATAIGPDGRPILPPVPAAPGLPPAVVPPQAADPQGPTSVADSRPLDLSPDQPPEPAAATQPVQPFYRPKPHSIPGRF